MARGERHLIRKVVAVAAIVAVSFAATLWALDILWPRGARAPIVVAETPPLPTVSRTSLVIAPTSIALSAIRDVMDRAAPANLTGKRDNPLSELLGKAEIGWSVSRGPLAIAGRPEGMTVTTALNGTLRSTGLLADGAGNVTGKLTSALGGAFAREVQGLTGRTLDQRADVRGAVAVTARPAILPNWRLEPNLSAQVTIAETSLSVAGVRVKVATEVKPLIDRAVDEQIAALQARLRTDPFVEIAARREWAKMCRSISLKGAAKDAPDLWLEMRPVRAFAAQPKTEANALVLTLGVEAETRVVAAQHKPNCPFPAKLDIVPPLEQGKLAIAVPIEVPFGEVNRLIAAQLEDRRFPADGSGPVTVTVLGAQVTPSADRLLISLRVKARAQKSFLGLGAEATVNVWGRPRLDRERQTLRLTDIALDVESEAAFGLLGAAARAMMPYLQAAIAENATVDLAPFAADARRGIEGALADFRRSAQGVAVEAAITGVRLADIAFDATTLRVIAEADGTARVAITSLTP